MYLLDIEPLDLGAEVKAIGLDLVQADENREQVRGREAAQIWSHVLSATAGQESWALDFFSHFDRVRDFCQRHEIPYREASQRSIIIPAPELAPLESLIDRFQAETFGLRAGGPMASPEGDPVLEVDLARRGVDAYHPVLRNYFFCGVCGFEDGSVVLLSEKLWAGEVIRRVRPTLRGLDVEVRLPS